MFESWVINENWIIDPVDLSSAFLQSVRYLRCVAFFTICMKSTMAFTFTSLPLNVYTSVSGCGCGFGFEKKYWRIDEFSKKKRHGSADLHIPIHPLFFFILLNNFAHHTLETIFIVLKYHNLLIDT